MLMLSNAVTAYSRHLVNVCGRKRGEIESFYSFIHSEIFIEDLLWAWLFASSQATKVSMSEVIPPAH